MAKIPRKQASAMTRRLSVKIETRNLNQPDVQSFGAAGLKPLLIFAKA